MRFLLVLAVFALLLSSSGGAAARTSGVSPSTHGLPQVGDPGVQFTCLDAAYSCVAGSGYNTLTAEASGWPWTDYGGTNASTNAAGSHNCTLYSAFRLEQEGANQPSWYDNAPGWATKAAASGTPVDQNPTAGSIAQWNTGVGHVAYVEAVTASSITVTGDNYYTASRVVDGIQLKGGYTETVVIQRSSPDWPDNFIHFTVARSTTPNSYEGHMVHSSDDTKVQKTSYLVGPGSTMRRWIGDTSTYWCLARDRYTDLGGIPQSTLSAMPYSGVRVYCADVNSDHIVDGSDLSLFLANYRTKWPPEDINGDGVVNLTDFSILLAHYGKPF